MPHAAYETPMKPSSEADERSVDDPHSVASVSSPNPANLNRPIVLREMDDVRSHFMRHVSASLCLLDGPTTEARWVMGESRSQALRACPEIRP